MSGSGSEDSDAFVVKADKPGPSKKKTPLKSKAAKRSATPSSSKRGSKRKNQDGDEEQDTSLRFCLPDSEDDAEEDESMSRKKWEMVESKPNGTRYSKGQPTNLDHRYVNRGIVTREEKPVPSWWKTTKVLRTEMKMSDNPEEQADNKLRDFFLKLGKEEPVHSQQSESSQYTPLTPDVIEVIVLKLTPEMRRRAEDKIRTAGEEGLVVPGTNYRVCYKPPNSRFKRPWGLFGTLADNRGSVKWICTADPNCVKRHGTKLEQYPKCRVHKGGQLGFVLGEFVDSANKKNEVILHVISSFTYTDGDDAGKEESATGELINSISGQKMWVVYKKEREHLDKPSPMLSEVKERRRYFDSEGEMMKIYTARQTGTFFRMLLWPDTTTRIICLNTYINFPNGAYKELVEELDLFGIDLRIHDKLQPDAAKELVFPKDLEIPFLLKAKPGESVQELLTRGNAIESLPEAKKEKVAALYFLSSPYVLYGGQALSGNVHTRHSQDQSDPVNDYKSNMGNHPEPQIVPVGVVLAEERYKWEFILHVSGLIVSLLGLPNLINPNQYTAKSHPLCLNRQTNASFLDKKSWAIIHNFIVKNFFVDVYLGPKPTVNVNP